jgi:hypothetical protein
MDGSDLQKAADYWPIPDPDTESTEQNLTTGAVDCTFLSVQPLASQF